MHTALDRRKMLIGKHWERLQAVTCVRLAVAADGPVARLPSHVVPRWRIAADSRAAQSAVVAAEADLNSALSKLVC
jgi:hypothetical protein